MAPRSAGEKQEALNHGWHRWHGSGEAMSHGLGVGFSICADPMICGPRLAFGCCERLR